jgi:hypothetical protein
LVSFPDRFRDAVLKVLERLSREAEEEGVGAEEAVQQAKRSLTQALDKAEAIRRDVAGGQTQKGLMWAALVEIGEGVLL